MSTITYIVNGVIGAQTGPYSYYWTGIDGGGFGPTGASIVGDHFWATWTGTPCNCIGGDPPSFPLPNPIQDVTLQIGTQPYGHNPIYDFGPASNFGYGEWYPGNPPYSGLQQVGGSTGLISTSFGFSVDPDGPNGAFRIAIGDNTINWTSGTFGYGGWRSGTGGRQRLAWAVADDRLADPQRPTATPLVIFPPGIAPPR
jgi:hypothetical protein